MRHTDLVVVQTFGSQVEADIAKSALDSAGIAAMIQSDTAGGMRQHLAWSGSGFKLLVREEDGAAARDVLTSASKLGVTGLTTIRSFTTADEADNARGALESAGIYATIESDESAEKRLHLLRLTAPRFRLLVRDEDAALAGEVLQRLV